MYEELVKALRKAVVKQECGRCVLANECLSSDKERCIFHEAADAIEELNGLLYEAERDRDENRERLDKEYGLRVKALNRLCEWCGVCPKEKQNAMNCEIAMIGSEYTEPPKED